MKLFKYVEEENLKHERIEFLPELGMKLRPNDPEDKSQVMAIFQDNFMRFYHDKPEWYDDDYSEQYANISPDMMRDYAETLLSQGVKPYDILKMFNRTYRFKGLSVVELNQIAGNIL